MLKQQQQRELSELDKSVLAVATQSEHLVTKYQETSKRQKAMVLRCGVLHTRLIVFGCVLILYYLDV